jgi:hypothetical protein
MVQLKDGCSSMSATRLYSYPCNQRCTAARLQWTRTFSPCRETSTAPLILLGSEAEVTTRQQKPSFTYFSFSCNDESTPPCMRGTASSDYAHPGMAQTSLTTTAGCVYSKPEMNCLARRRRALREDIKKQVR